MMSFGSAAALQDSRMASLNIIGQNGNSRAIIWINVAHCTCQCSHNDTHKVALDSLFWTCQEIIGKNPPAAEPEADQDAVLSCSSDNYFFAEFLYQLSSALFSSSWRAE